MQSSAYKGRIFLLGVMIALLTAVVLISALTLLPPPPPGPPTPTLPYFLGPPVERPHQDY
ncbi:MAG: hypothetical protein KJ047_00350 [Anaerolineae bacterium]|nr:hypothetical protein [Anaerolineae bacterium]MEB2286895.1 hypothetical protein [Anaerolineae bacterium]